jgi:hypothetical protein
MPDWFAHIMLATVASTCLRLTGGKRVLFFIGNVMPDLIRFLVLIDYMLDSPAFYSLVGVPLNIGAHSLLGVLAYAILLSIFFEPTITKPVTLMPEGSLQAAITRNSGFTAAASRRWQLLSGKPIFLLVLGGVTHLFLDTFMWPYGGGIMWLYPLEHAAFRWSFGAWWPGTLDGIVWLLPFFTAAIIFELLHFYKQRRR